MPTKLGQNFLKNEEIAKGITKAANLMLDDLVLEIGPGRGILTEELAKYAGKVITVEIDKKLVEVLKNKFKDQESVEIINEDILKINVESLFCHSEGGLRLIGGRSEAREGREAKSNKDKLDPSASLRMTCNNYKIISNLPYYITSPVIRKFLESDMPPSEMILMVQKEVAERICSGPGKMSILAVSVQYYAKPELLFYVEKENFEPVPEVDSAVIRVTSDKRQETRDKEFNKKFFRVVRAGFCAKRKTLANNLANSFYLDRKAVEEKLKITGISPIARAQELNIEDWKRIVNSDIIKT